MVIVLVTFIVDLVGDTDDVATVLVEVTLMVAAGDALVDIANKEVTLLSVKENTCDAV